MEQQKNMQVEKKENDKKEEGASLVEYALLLALIAVVCIVAVRVIGSRASSQFSSISTQI